MKFLTIEEVLEIHNEMIKIKGLPGIRDFGLLSSAIEMPKAIFAGEYLHQTTFDMAAAYMYHIICNHPFNDANKRTGVAVSLIFLEMNGCEITNDKDLEKLVIDTAKGLATKDQISLFFKNNSTSL